LLWGRTLFRLGGSGRRLGLRLSANAQFDLLFIAPHLFETLALLDLLIAALGLFASRRRLCALHPAHEALDLAGGVNNTLLPSVERVAVRADINMQRRAR